MSRAGVMLSDARIAKRLRLSRATRFAMRGRLVSLRELRAAILALTVCATACTHGAHRNPASVTRPLKRGDRVVIEQTAAQFFEGRVLAVSGSTLRIQTAARPDSLQVQVGDAYRLPPAAHRFATGELVICEVTPAHWKPCRIDAVASRITAHSVEGSPVQLSAEQVLAPTPVTLLNLRHAFHIAQIQAAFRSGLARAGRPRAPSGWTPSRSDHVLAERSEAWYSATIREVKDKGVTVIFRGDQDVTEIPSASVVPEPPYPAKLTAGDYALARPVSLSQPWKPVRVTSAVADSIGALDIDGNKLTLSSRDVVPLVKP